MKDTENEKRKLSLDDLNSYIYSRRGPVKQRKRRTIHRRNIELEHDFPDNNFDELKNARKKYKLPSSFFKKMFITVLILFGITALFAIVIVNNKQSISGDLISVEILGQPLVDGGEELTLQVRIQNKNKEELEFPDLILSYPKDSSIDQDKIFLRRSLPNIMQGQEALEEFNIVLFGQEADSRTIEASLEYRIGSSNAIFVKNSSHDVVIRSTPSILIVDAKDEISQGQIFDLAIDVSANSSKNISDGLLKIDYPHGFNFISASPPPSILNNTWDISPLTETKKTIIVKGRLSALEGRAQSFSIDFGKKDSKKQNEIETVYNNAIHLVNIVRSFIDSKVTINRSENDTVAIRGGGNVSGDIAYTNTTDDILSNVELRLHLDGNLYDQTLINSSAGFFESNTQSIVWNKDTTRGLATLLPNETRYLNFSFRTKELVDTGNSISNPQLDLSLDVSANLPNGETRSAVDVTRKTIVANSDLNIITKVDYQDGPFKNYGPVPPRVNVPSSYTVTYQLTNSSNEVQDATVTFTLPRYVSWKNNISPTNQRGNVRYNENTREITWSIDRLLPKLGTNGSSPLSLSFQVEVIPSASQIGKSVAITSDITLNGKDVFTDTDLILKKSALNNRLSNTKENGYEGLITP